MNTNNQSNAHQPHLADANNIWGISFFWTKNLKFEEREIKEVTERVIVIDEHTLNPNGKQEKCF